MVRRVVFALAVTLLVVAAAGATISGPVTAQNHAGDRLESAQTGEFDSTVFRITVFENGSARWTVEHSRQLDNETERDRFREFAETFTSEETETYRNFQIRAGRLTDSGTEATGREMNATGFSRDAEVEQLGQPRGVVRLSFRWSNFARVQDGTVTVGDVFDGGMVIVENQRLEIRAGGTLLFADGGVDPPPDSMSAAGNLTASESVTWFGEQQFADNRPRVAFVTAEAAGSSDTPESADGTPETPASGGEADGGGDGGDARGTPEDGTDGIGWLSAALLVVFVGLAGGLAWYLRSLSRRGEGGRTAGDSADETPDVGAIAEGELLTDEDRVLRLLEENGGRMKQVAIVEETDWSKSKVSMLLSEMAEDGQISKLRIGRENIISLAGEEPDAAGSPFDGE